jgi:type II secretory pathway pseudopilin PulG
MKIGKFFRNEKGFSIVEVVAAVGILMTGAVGTLGSIESCLNGTNTSRHVMVAVNYAHAKMEEIRSVSFANTTTTYPDNSASPTAVSSLPSGQWYRTYPDGTSANPLKIRVIVSWVERNKTRSVKIETLVNSD